MSDHENAAIKRVIELLDEKIALQAERDAAVAEAAAMRQALEVFRDWHGEDDNADDQLREAVRLLDTPGPGQALLARLEAAEAGLVVSDENLVTAIDSLKASEAEVERLKAELEESLRDEERACEALASCSDGIDMLLVVTILDETRDERDTARATVREACGLLRDYTGGTASDFTSPPTKHPMVQRFLDAHDKRGE